MAPVQLHLRSEDKEAEHRSALTPATVAALLQHGFEVTVERSEQRIFDDKEFGDVGAELSEPGSWRHAPRSAYIIGLKELPEDGNAPLPHTHIMFAHCFKKQAGWKDVLGRWAAGGGTLLDLEFLTDAEGRRVAAFGYHAGFTGGALGLKVWAYRQTGKETAGGSFSVKPSPNEDSLVRDVREALGTVRHRQPKVIVIGALGRCGTGAVDFCTKVGIPAENLIRWDLAETARGDQFPEILDSDIFINCIYLSQPGPPFVTGQMLKQRPDRALDVIVDISCDPTNPYNPIPIYNHTTTFANPCLETPVEGSNRPMTVIAIDHLPTMLPREASEAFSKALLPYLYELQDRTNSEVWTKAEALFQEKIKEVNATD